ncbi:MAG: hypothetical protein K5694_05815 [Bacilli bacterium]|nr:hypothetical protein [Bacilli bacterium]
MKKKFIAILSMGAMLALSACGGSNTPAGSSSEVSSSSVESSEPEASSSVDPSVKQVIMTLAHNEIPVGGSFFDNCKPTVMYYDGKGGSKDMTEYKYKTTFTITNEARTETYDAGEVLTVPGKYYAKAEAESRRHEVEFTVVDGEPIEASEGNGYSVKENFDDTYWQPKYPSLGTLGKAKFPCVGNPKLLVIPIYFTNTKEFSEDDLEKVNRAFFGESEDMNYFESLASYYKKASYGKLNIEGVVSVPYMYPKKDSDIKSSNEVATIINSAVSWLKSNGHIDPLDYDSDGDGYIDGIDVVYQTTIQHDPEGDSSLWWNFTSATGNQPNLTSPVCYKYFWSRYDFLVDHYGYDIDCHTLIHENGHLMGAPDYYSYDRTEGPAGCVDMMDMNVGDHNAYTKMNYNWVSPKYIDGSADNFYITLNSFADTGDCLIVRNTSDDPWNETQFDEYLVLEYYTPTGVNKADSKGYAEWLSATSSDGKTSAYGHAGTYEKPGLKVFHVDARLYSQYGTYDSSTHKTTSLGYHYTDNVFAEQVVDLENGTYEGVSVQGFDNTPSRSKYIDENGKERSKSPYFELAAVSPSGLSSFVGSSYYSTMGSQANIFGDEESGNGGTFYSNYKMRGQFVNDLLWNDGSRLNWTWSIVEQDFDETAEEGTNSGSIKLHFVCTD